MYTKLSVVALFCATLATAQGLYATGLTPAQVRNLARDHDERRLTFIQSAAISAAQQSYLASVTVQPAWSTVIQYLATASGDALSVLANLGSGPTDSAQLAVVESAIAAMPSPESAFFASMVSADEAIVSSVLATLTSSSSSVTITSSQITSAANITQASNSTGVATEVVTTYNSTLLLSTTIGATKSATKTTGAGAVSTTSSKAGAPTAGFGSMISGAILMGAAAAVAML
jgi:hypothetical protein